MPPTDDIKPKADPLPPRILTEETPPTDPADAKKTKSFEDEHADLIREKMHAGLRRDQAIEVIKTQLAEDAKPKTKTKPAKGDK